MRFTNYLLLFLISIAILSCSKDITKETIIKEKNLNLQVLEAYKEGKEALDAGDVFLAAKKFNEAEMLFPQSEWAPKSALMAAYSYYLDDYLDDSIAELERFIRIYPFDKNLDYAFYLLANCYYEKIVDEKKDLQSIIDASKTFKALITNCPNTEYALDAEFKLDLINDILASKEMYVGRYYFDRKKWIPAINRFRVVVDEYDQTIYIEEALHRLVEIYYILGLKEESEKFAKVLGYNYGSSKWYEKSYSVFNKTYEKKQIGKEKKHNKIIKKFKFLLD